MLSYISLCSLFYHLFFPYSFLPSCRYFFSVLYFFSYKKVTESWGRNKEDMQEGSKQYTKMTNKMQQRRIIYYSLTAPHVSSDIFAHHQEYLNCITASGITHVCRCGLVSWECSEFQHSHDTSRQRHTCVIPEAVIQFRYSWWWAKISLETCRAPKE